VSFSKPLQNSTFETSVAPTKLVISITMRKNSSYSELQLHNGQYQVMDSASQLSIKLSCMCDNGYSHDCSIACCLVRMQFKTLSNHLSAPEKSKDINSKLTLSDANTQMTNETTL
jgi:hypothetical protein